MNRNICIIIIIIFHALSQCQSVDGILMRGFYQLHVRSVSHFIVRLWDNNNELIFHKFLYCVPDSMLAPVVFTVIYIVDILKTMFVHVIIIILIDILL